jgi:hypothetical protein
MPDVPPDESADCPEAAMSACQWSDTVTCNVPPPDFTGFVWYGTTMSYPIQGGIAYDGILVFDYVYG